ncbi:MAG: hypothetical protein M1608_09075 [Candidatus Omnitrophica bacterium]|nr:hypothetical protein [Candidatus Omnitrophota bacterium]
MLRLEREVVVLLVAVGALGISCMMTQLALMREMLEVFGGNEMVLGILLGNWLLLSGIGAGLGRMADRLKNPIRFLVVAQILVAILPLVQVFLLRTIRNLVFTPGAQIGVLETVASSFLLLSPYCLLSGVFLILVCSILSAKEEAKGIGRVYQADCLGSLAGGILFSFVLVQLWDHLRLLTFPAMLNLAAAWLIICHWNKDYRVIAGNDTGVERPSGPASPHPRRASRAVDAWALNAPKRAWTASVGVTAAFILGLALFTNLDAYSTALQYPGQNLLITVQSPYGKLVLTESGGQLNFFENGLPIASTQDRARVEESVHYAMSQRPDARWVLLLFNGIWGTAKEILQYGVDKVDYLERDPCLIEAGRKYLATNLDDQRINLLNADLRGGWTGLC